MRRAILILATVLVAGFASAQQRLFVDPDDFLNPRQHEGPVFISRLVMGVVKDGVDDFRPLGQDAGVLHIANSFYWSHFQLDYKRTELRGENASNPAALTECGCSNEPIYFPTPPPAGATPAPPLPGSKDTLQFAFYRTKDFGEVRPPVALRTRFTLTDQKIDTVIQSPRGDEVSRMHGSERSLGFDADTHFRLGGHDFFGSLLFAHNRRRGTTDNRSQSEIAYVSRFRVYAAGPILIRPTLTVGGTSGRGARGINVVSPSVELFWHEPRSRANLHLVLSPHAMRSGIGGWEYTNQIALFADYTLYAKVFRSLRVRPEG
jgi:hypothetical protein